MTRIYVLADTHLYAPKALHEIEKPDGNTLYLRCVGDYIEYDKWCEKNNIKLFLVGDIVDVKNTRKSEIKQALVDILVLRKHFGRRYILGNHELKVESSEYSYDYSFFTEDRQRVALSHGHRFFWKYEKGIEEGWKKVRKWEYREPKGISNCKWKKMQAVHWFDETFLRGNKPLKPTKKLLNALDRYTSADIWICGHKHKSMDIKHNGKRFIVCGRGLTTIED